MPSQIMRRTRKSRREDSVPSPNAPNGDGAQTAGPSCARLGPFGFAEGRLARAPVPTRALRLRLLILVEGVQEPVNVLLRQVVRRGQAQLVRVGSADAN